MVLKRCGGIFVINVVGDTVNANPAPEPPWDRRIARSLEPFRSKRTPPRAMHGSISSGSNALGRTPSQRTCQDGGSKPIVPTNDLAQSATAPQNGVSGCPSNCATIANATPRWRADTIGRQSAQLAQEAEALILDAILSPTPPKTNGKLALLLMFSLARIHVEEMAQTTPNVVVVCPGILSHRLGLDHPEQVLGSARCAVQENLPC